MKKLLAILLLSSAAYAQDRYTFVTAGFDLANAVVGSKPTDNKQSLDFHIKVGAVDENWNTEIYIQYENFAAIDFQKYGPGVNLILFPFYKVDLAMGLEGGFIVREKNSSYMYYGGNIEVRYELTKKLSLGAQGNYSWRPDITYLYNTGKTEYRFSGYINLRYRLN